MGSDDADVVVTTVPTSRVRIEQRPPRSAYSVHPDPGSGTIVVMASRNRSAATPAVAALVTAGIGHTVHVYRAGTGDFGDEAAEILGDRLGVDAERVVKTLVVSAGPSGCSGRPQLALAVLPGTDRLDLKAAAAALGWSAATMAPVAEAERTTGYVRGGISPLGGRRRLPCVVDDSVYGHPTVFCSAGRRGWEVEIDPADLVRATGATTARIRTLGRGPVADTAV